MRSTAPFFVWDEIVTGMTDPWLMRLPLYRDQPVIGYGVAVIAAALAFALRRALDSVLPPGFPYLTFFPAVVGVAFFFGPHAGALSAGLGLVLSWYYFISPGQFALTSGTAVALALYLFVVMVDIVLIHWLQQAQARALSARQQSRDLAEIRETLFRELQHRVGNNLQMVGALLSLQKRKLTDPAAVAAIAEAAQRVNLIGRIQRQLYDPDGHQLGIAGLIERAVHDNVAAAGRDDLTIALQIPESIRMRPDMAIPTTLIVSEAVANAIEHGFAGRSGTVSVTVANEGEWIAIAIRDDGRGLPEGFVMAKDQNLGIKLSSALAQQFGGTFTLTSEAGSTAAVLRLPNATV